MDTIRAKVVGKRDLTQHIAEFTLEPIEGGTLPTFTPAKRTSVPTPMPSAERKDAL